MATRDRIRMLVDYDPYPGSIFAELYNDLENAEEGFGLVVERRLEARIRCQVGGFIATRGGGRIVRQDIDEKEPGKVWDMKCPERWIRSLLSRLEDLDLWQHGDYETEGCIDGEGIGVYARDWRPREFYAEWLNPIYSDNGDFVRLVKTIRRLSRASRAQLRARMLLAWLRLGRS